MNKVNKKAKTKQKLNKKTRTRKKLILSNLHRVKNKLKAVKNQ